jgi:hypothetical protein
LSSKTSKRQRAKRNSECVAKLAAVDFHRQ